MNVLCNPCLTRNVYTYNKMEFANLPNPALLKVIGHLPESDLVNLNLVCKNLKNNDCVSYVTEEAKKKKVAEHTHLDKFNSLAYFAYENDSDEYGDIDSRRLVFAITPAITPNNEKLSIVFNVSNNIDEDAVYLQVKPFADHVKVISVVYKAMAKHTLERLLTLVPKEIPTSYYLSEVQISQINSNPEEIKKVFDASIQILRGILGQVSPGSSGGKKCKVQRRYKDSKDQTQKNTSKASRIQKSKKKQEQKWIKTNKTAETAKGLRVLYKSNLSGELRVRKMVTRNGVKTYAYVKA